MTDLSPRETAARALWIAEQESDRNRAAAARYWDQADLSDAVIPRPTYRHQAASALAAVAAHDGLADALRGHSPVLSTHPTTHIVCCDDCEWVAPDANSLWPEFADHLADVVRAWMTGDDGATPVKRGPTILVTEQGLDTLAHTWNSALGMAEGFDDQEETGA